MLISKYCCLAFILLSMVVGNVYRRGEKTQIVSSKLSGDDQTAEICGQTHSPEVSRAKSASGLQPEATAGRWVRYKQGSDAGIVLDSWSEEVKSQTATWFGDSLSSAEEYSSTLARNLKEGDLYAYYADSKGDDPRLLIKMYKGEVCEIYGRGEQGNLEKADLDLVSSKLDSLSGEGVNIGAWKAKLDVNRRIAEIDDKIQQNKRLSDEDWVFVLERDAKVRAHYNIDSAFDGLSGTDYSPCYQLERIKEAVRKDELISAYARVYGVNADQVHADQHGTPNNDVKLWIGDFYSMKDDALPPNLTHVLGSVLIALNISGSWPVDLRRVHGNFTIGHNVGRSAPSIKLTSLPPNLECVYGDLNVKAPVDNWPENLKMIKGNGLSYTKFSLFNGSDKVTTMPENVHIGGNLVLEGCPKLTALPEGLSVAGYLDIRNAHIKRIPASVQYGSLFLPAGKQLNADGTITDQAT